MVEAPQPKDLLYDFERLPDAEHQARALKRCQYFDATFTAYAKQIKKRGLEKIQLNRLQLAHAVESYFLDIQRVKDFHGMERADHFKVAGYTLKWLSKIRPIQILDEPPPNAPNDLQRRVLLINADFALINALVFAGVDRKQIPDEGIYLDWLYTAEFRYIDGGVIGQMLEAAARSWPATGILT